MEESLQKVVIWACILIMVGGVTGVFVDRIKNKKGFGVRIIQFLTSVLVIPTIIILSINESLSTETVATLLGTIIGYILSGFGKDEEKNS